MDILADMQWYSIQFLGDLAMFLVNSPVAMIFICLFFLAVGTGIFKRMVDLH